jgi:DNA-binding SARP family transcriptional activator
MNYEVLGQIRVSGASGVTAPTARKVETLLAILLAKANQVVSTEQLVTEIWGDNAPSSANAALYVYISQLRKFLRASTGGDNPVITSGHGYSLRVAADELDSDRFTRLYQQGRKAHRDRSYGQAAETLRAAWRLWRGPAFGGHSESPLVSAYATFLEENRLECVELLLETELLIGRHREIIGQLSALTKEHTLRETFYQYLMIALSRCGRRAEALEVFTVARKNLTRQLGIEPGRSLRDLHMKILTEELVDAV